MRFIWVLLLVVMCGTVQAQMWPMTEGTQEIHVDGLMQWKGPAGRMAALGLGYGYFIFHDTEIGMRLNYLDDGMQKMYQGSVFFEQNYNINLFLTPYLGVSLGAVNSATTEDSNAALFGVRAGFKYFLLQDLALDFSARFKAATGRVFLNEGRTRVFLDEGRTEESKTGSFVRTSLNLGLRFFF